MFDWSLNEFNLMSNWRDPNDQLAWALLLRGEVRGHVQAHGEEAKGASRRWLQSGGLWVCVRDCMCVCERQPQVMVRAVRVLQVSAFIVVLDVPEEINSSPAHQHIVHSTTFMNNQTWNTNVWLAHVNTLLVELGIDIDFMIQLDSQAALQFKFYLILFLCMYMVEYISMFLKVEKFEQKLWFIQPCII